VTFSESCSVISVNLNRNNPANFREFQSWIEIPEQVPADAAYSIINHSAPTPGILFSQGWVNRANNTAITDEGGGTIKIYTNDTTRFREGHTIEVLQSTSYAGEIGTIQVSGIDVGVSITVDIAFVAGDTGILMRDNSLASKDPTDPQVTGLLNTGLSNSTTTAQVCIPYDGTEVLVTGVTGTPQVITTARWQAVTEAFERMELSISNQGQVKYIGIEDKRLLVTYSAQISEKIGGITMLLNDVEFSEAPPVMVDSSQNNLVGTDLIPIVTGDTLDLGIFNTEGGPDDMKVWQTNVTYGVID